MSPGRPADRRSRILAAALRCFAKRGVAATTVEDVLRASHSSVGSFYHFFESKQALAGAVYVEGLRAYHESLFTCMRGLRGPEALVRGVVAHYVAWVTRHPVQARYLLEHRRASHVTALEREVRDATREAIAAFEAQLAPFVSEGRIARLPPEIYAAQLLAPVQSLAAHWLRQGRSEELRAAAPALAESAWRAIRRDP